MNSWALAITSLACVATLLLPRKYALSPLIVGAVCIPPNNGFVIADINLPVLRILLLCLLLRGLIRREPNLAPPSDLDRYILVWAFWMTVSYLAVTFTLSAAVNRVGTLWIDLVLAYFLCRKYLEDLPSVFRISHLLILVTVILVIATFVEYFARHNLFATLGGMGFVQIRGDTLRCQGPFGHPINLGSFVALCVPLIWAAFKADRIGCVHFSILVAVSASVALFSGSSSSVFTLATAIIVAAFWRFRGCIRQIRWLLVAVVCCLAIAMNAPVWYLMARLNPMGGSAYHRARLMDHFVAHLDDWWLFGTRSNAQWGYLTEDVANYFLYIGAAGGILGILLFVWIFVIAFKRIGFSLQLPNAPADCKFLLWAFGSILVAHLVTFVGTSYWDQMRFILYLHFAMIASTSSLVSSIDAPEDHAEQSNEEISKEPALNVHL